MRKQFILVLVLFSAAFFAASASAQLLVGARAAGLGGSGVATARDLSAAYYNPAALQKAGKAEFRLSAGVTADSSKIASVAGDFSGNLGKFLSDNYAQALGFNGTANLMLGINVGKIGLSVIPERNNLLAVNVSKPANSLAGTMSGTLNSAGVLTLGRSFSLPGLPAELDLGINAKYLYLPYGSVTTTATAGTQSWGTGTGYGFDAGLLTTVGAPLFGELSVGFVARDLMTTVAYKNKTQTLTVSGTDFTKGAETDLPDTSVAVPSSYVLGASGTIPGVGLLLAADLENVSGSGVTNTHLGVEYPLLFGTIVARGGLAFGNNLSLTTLGARVALPFFTLDAASVIDNTNSGNNSYVADVALGI